MDRVFLDANVLVSAALTPRSRLGELWRLTGVRLLASPYVLEEARRNVAGAEASERLAALIGRMAVLPTEPSDFGIDDDPGLPDKDRPVLLAAIAAGADILLTGDMTHFGPCYGHSFAGVTVMLPGDYLRGRADECADAEG